MGKKMNNTVRLVWESKTDEPIIIQAGQAGMPREWERVFPRPVFASDQPFFEESFHAENIPGLVENLFFHGDNLELLKNIAIRNNPKIDLIYLDPPYMSDTVYYSSIDTGGDKQQTLNIRRTAFEDHWEKGIDSYLDMLYPRLLLMKQVLSDEGNILIHLDWHISHYVRVLLDEIFGHDNLVNEIIWCYGGGSRPKKHFQRKHDVIFWYAKSDKYIFNPQYRPYTQGTLQRGLTRVKGDNYQLHSEGALMQDWWTDINKILSPTAFENFKYPTQKPRELLKRLIMSASNPGARVADFFAGSGTTAEVCNELGRKWILCDSSFLSLQTCLYRLIKSGSPPFRIDVTNNCENKSSGRLLLKSPLLQKYDDNNYLINIGIECYLPANMARESYDTEDGAFIEFWEVDLNYTNDLFKSSFQIMRNGDRFKGSIPLDIVTIIPKKEQIKIAVKVYDVYANYTQKIIDIKP